MTKTAILLSLFFTFCIPPCMAQYAPQVPLTGNEGIPDSSPLFKAWASGCTLYRGWLDIADKGLGQPIIGTESDVYGMPGTGLLSLGDSGVAVVTFDHSIYNGEGPDFAVFENAFANPQNDTFAYLELAFVEVSSDGANFFRFPASSLMQDTIQIDNFTYSDARFYHNLAGKYVAGYGTPFDLEELKNIPGLDVDHITHVRIVDVVGSIDPLYASYDKDDHIINDPYPSPYPSGGFDLNAIGVIHSNAPATGIYDPATDAAIRVFPNPATDKIHIATGNLGLAEYRLTDISGRTISTGAGTGKITLSLTAQLPGLYLLYIGKAPAQAIFKITKL